ncbi:hypothetical protein E2320_012334 [Naja naja]|nr:hypothetical protein E2320_012334 [Naja naja]
MAKLFPSPRPSVSGTEVSKINTQNFCIFDTGKSYSPQQSRWCYCSYLKKLNLTLQVPSGRKPKVINNLLHTETRTQEEIKGLKMPPPKKKFFLEAACLLRLGIKHKPLTIGKTEPRIQRHTAQFSSLKSVEGSLRCCAFSPCWKRSLRTVVLFGTAVVVPSKKEWGAEKLLWATNSWGAFNNWWANISLEYTGIRILCQIKEYIISSEKGYVAEGLSYSHLF